MKPVHCVGDHENSFTIAKRKCETSEDGHSALSKRIAEVLVEHVITATGQALLMRSGLANFDAAQNV